jgi:hypothetical protein
MEIGPQFKYYEENLMDRFDQRRRDSGIRLHYAVTSNKYEPDDPNQDIHHLYATEPNNNKIIGHISWNHETGEVKELEVHPNYQKGITTPTLLKAANDFRMRTSETGEGIRSSSATTKQGFSIVKKLDPKHESVTNPDRRDKDGDYSHPFMVKGRLNGVDTGEFRCADCWNDMLHPNHTRSIESMLGWE